MKVFIFIAMVLYAQVLVIGASITGDDATCSFVLTASNHLDSASSASLLDAAVDKVAGGNVVVLTPTKPLERGMIGGKVVFSGETALNDATNLCQSIEEELVDILDGTLGLATFVAANVLEGSAYAAKDSRKTCYPYNWMCWMNCNRGYKAYSIRCCCK